jgi:hypothetical protein
MIPEVAHVMKQWAGVDFSKNRVDGLLKRLAAYLAVEPTPIA